LTNLQFSQAGAYQLVVSNSYGAVTSKAAKLVVTLPLGQALDTTNVNWTSTGGALWFGQTNVAYDGTDAARSGDIGSSQESVLQTTLGGPAQISFWWKVSSEAGFDVLEFKVNGATLDTISGEADWQFRSYTLGSGLNTLQWRYAKDATSSAGLDAAWMDQFVYAPDRPVITLQPVSQIANVSNTVIFRIQASGAGTLNFMWRKDVTNSLSSIVTGGTNSTVTLTGVGRAQRGTYSCIVSNDGGAVTSSNAILMVIVPQKMGNPVLLADRTLRLTSGDVDGGAITPEYLANFQVQTSTNLASWTTLPATLSLTNGMLQFNDPAPTNTFLRFYRIIENQ